MKSKKEDVLAYSILILMGIVFTLPLLWIVFASLDKNAATGFKMPEQFTLQNYANVIKSGKNQTAFGVGLILSLGQTLLVVCVTALASYPLSRYEIKHKQMFMYTVLFMSCLPITTVIIPVFKQFVFMGLMDSIPGVILFMTAFSLPYSMWMTKNFMDKVPIELEEAAFLDGATTFQSLVRIVIPLMAPGLWTVAIYTFTGSWSNFFVPFILLQNADKYPASVRLFQFFSEHNVNYGELAAYSLLYASPSILLYVFSQRFMSKGFGLGGATKG